VSFENILKYIKARIIYKGMQAWKNKNKTFPKDLIDNHLV
jgi:hypothetical protein